MKKIIFFFLVLLIFNSCKKSKKYSKIINLDWLIGTWNIQTEHGNLSEKWKKINDSVFIGESYYIKGDDTLHKEKMELKQKLDQLYYISTIQGQNKDKSISFKHNLDIENQVVFENFKNNYPKKITYKHLSKNKLLITLSGIQEEKTSIDKYLMNRTTN